MQGQNQTIKNRLRSLIQAGLDCITNDKLYKSLDEVFGDYIPVYNEQGTDDVMQ